MDIRRALSADKNMFARCMARARLRSGTGRLATRALRGEKPRAEQQGKQYWASWSCETKLPPQDETHLGATPATTPLSIINAVPGSPPLAITVPTGW